MNLQKLMQQAQQMQAKLQREMEEMVVEVAVGGGMVTVRMAGTKHLVGIEIDPEVLDPEVSESELNQILLAGARKHLRSDLGHVLVMAPQKLYLLWSPLPGKLTSPLPFTSPDAIGWGSTPLTNR